METKRNPQEAEGDDFNFSERLLALKAGFELRLAEEGKLYQPMAGNLKKIVIPGSQQK